jgi:hypothetical protein
MPDIIADPPTPRCFPLFLDSKASNINYLVLICCSLARAPRGRFAVGQSVQPARALPEVRCAFIALRS